MPQLIRILCNLINIIKGYISISWTYLRSNIVIVILPLLTLNNLMNIVIHLIQDINLKLITELYQYISIKLLNRVIYFVVYFGIVMFFRFMLLCPTVDCTDINDIYEPYPWDTWSSAYTIDNPDYIYKRDNPDEDVWSNIDWTKTYDLNQAIADSTTIKGKAAVESKKLLNMTASLPSSSSTTVTGIPSSVSSSSVTIPSSVSSSSVTIPSSVSSSSSSSSSSVTGLSSPSSPANTYIMSLQEVIEREELQEYSTKPVLDILTKLNKLELEQITSASLLRERINTLLPPIDIASDNYLDLDRDIRGNTFAIIEKLDIIASYTRNPLLIKYIAYYYVNSFIFTERRSNRLFTKDDMVAIYKSVISLYIPTKV